MSLAYETPPEVRIPSGARKRAASRRRRRQKVAAVGSPGVGRVVPFRVRSVGRAGSSAVGGLAGAGIRSFRSGPQPGAPLDDRTDGWWDGCPELDRGHRPDSAISARRGTEAGPAESAMSSPDPHRGVRAGLRTARVVSCRRTPVSPSEPSAAVRLTVRGRRVVVGAVSAVVVAGALAAGWSTAAALRAPLIPDSAPASVVVGPGDTLWSIAASVAPDRDPRAVVAALRERNGLDSPMIHSGQWLVVRR